MADGEASWEKLVTFNRVREKIKWKITY